MELREEEREVKGIYYAGPDFMLGVWEAGHITGGPNRNFHDEAAGTLCS